MKEKKVQVGDREFTIRELLYRDLAELQDLSKSEMVKRQLFLATDLTEEEYDKLTIKDGITLQQEVNELNNLSDFQIPLQTPE